MASKSKINDTALGRERARRCFYMRQDGYDFRFIAAVFRCRGPGEARAWVAKGERLHAQALTQTANLPMGTGVAALNGETMYLGKHGMAIVGSADEVAAEIGRSRGAAGLSLIQKAKRKNQLRKGE